jgi:hypothetical protein
MEALQLSRLPGDTQCCAGAVAQKMQPEAVQPHETNRKNQNDYHETIKPDTKCFCVEIPTNKMRRRVRTKEYPFRS